MMKFLCAVLLALMVAACGGGEKKVLVETKKSVVVKPPETFYECPAITKLPEGEYTQQDVAELLAELYKNNRICKDSINKIKEFLENASGIVESR